MDLISQHSGGQGHLTCGITIIYRCHGILWLYLLASGVLIGHVRTLLCCVLITICGDLAGQGWCLCLECGQGLGRYSVYLYVYQHDKMGLIRDQYER